jgi:predicted CoA-binding protein
MTRSVKDEQLIKQILASTKTIAMVGVSLIQKKEPSNNIRRRPSIIVMKYLQEFGYRVIPVNPSSAGKKIHGETIVAKLEKVTIPIDIVNVFRPSKEAPIIAKQAVEIGAKVFWLQYGIQNQEAQKIAKLANIVYIANRCIKQEYQRLFLKVSPVFPALRT